MLYTNLSSLCVFFLFLVEGKFLVVVVSTTRGGRQTKVRVSMRRPTRDEGSVHSLDSESLHCHGVGIHRPAWTDEGVDQSGYRYDLLDPTLFWVLTFCPILCDCGPLRLGYSRSELTPVVFTLLVNFPSVLVDCSTELLTTNSTVSISLPYKYGECRYRVLCIVTTLSF